MVYLPNFTEKKSGSETAGSWTSARGLIDGPPRTGTHVFSLQFSGLTLLCDARKTFAQTFSNLEET